MIGRTGYLLRNADAARDRRDWNVAANAYAKVLRRKPGLTHIWVQYGHALKECGSVEEALIAYRTATRLCPSDADAHHQVARALRILGDDCGALASYDLALTLDPTLDDARREWIGDPVDEPVIKAVQEPEALPPQPEPAPSRFYAYFGPDSALTTLHNGQFIFVDPKDHVLTPQLVARGYWEAWVERVVLSLFNAGDHVIEVGANHGYYTLLMAEKIGPSGGLDAFEANPAMARLLERSLGMNNIENVRVHQSAVVDFEGAITFALSQDDSGSGYALAGEEGVRQGFQSIEAVAVTLDAMFPTEKIDFIRTDAEGSEPLIFFGARKLIERNPDIKLCIEWSVPMISTRADPARFVEEMVGCGFHFWEILPDSSLRSLTAEALLQLPFGNVVVARALPSAPNAIVEP